MTSVGFGALVTLGAPVTLGGLGASTSFTVAASTDDATTGTESNLDSSSDRSSANSLSIEPTPGIVTSTGLPSSGASFTGEPFTGEPFTGEPFTGAPFGERASNSASLSDSGSREPMPWTSNLGGAT